MPYLQLRISTDPDPSGNRTELNLLYLLKKLKRRVLEEDEDGMITAGFETRNNYGEPCHPHYHFHAYFDLDELVDPLRTFKNFLRREATKQGYHLAGNKVWACTLVEEPDDLDRWLRYPLKEKPIYDLCHDAFYSFNKIVPHQASPLFQQQQAAARQEQIRSIEINILKRNKTMEKQTFRDKLFKHLDSTLGPAPAAPPYTPSHQDIWIQILDYYQLQKKANCFKTVPVIPLAISSISKLSPTSNVTLCVQIPNRKSMVIT